MEKSILIYIKNWSKFHKGRRDVNNPSWFKFSHSFFDDPDFYDFSHEEKMCWLYLLCVAGKKNDDGNLRLSLPHAIHSACLDEKVIHRTIEKLKRLNIVEARTVRGRYVDGTFACSRQDKIREDKIREEETAHVDVTPRAQKYLSESDLDKIYQLYPRKIGKSRGYKILGKLASGELPLLETAVLRYRKHCSSVEPQFIQHFSTWASSWRDWLDANTGQVTNLSAPAPKIYTAASDSTDSIEPDPDRVRDIISSVTKQMT